MKKIQLNTGLLLCLLSIPFLGYSQAKLSATSSSGSAYSVISSAGWGNENPDCVHGSFGAHVTQASDGTLGKNVFVFHSHINADNDRCTNFDRVRMEIKGGGTSTLGHSNGQTAYYRWKFKLDANFVGSSNFCHIFQIKGYGGDDTGAPLITITPRASTLEVIHDGGDASGHGADLGRLKSVSLSGFKGQWVEAYVKYKSSDNGLFEITLTRVSDKAVLLSYSKSSGIDMWRAGASRNQGKWGVYRKKASGLRDEQVRFADFCVSESSSSQCPSTIKSAAVQGVSVSSDLNLTVFPNPAANGNAQIKYTLTKTSDVNMALYSSTGQMVQEIIKDVQEPGEYTTSLNTLGLSAGTYIVKIVSDGYTTTAKLNVVK